MNIKKLNEEIEKLNMPEALGDDTVLQLISNCDDVIKQLEDTLDYTRMTEIATKIAEVIDFYKKVKKVTDALANVSEAIDVDEYGDVVHNDSLENFWNVVYNTVKE